MKAQFEKERNKVLSEFVEIQNKIENVESKGKWIPFELSQRLNEIKIKLRFYNL